MSWWLIWYIQLIVSYPVLSFDWLEMLTLTQLLNNTKYQLNLRGKKCLLWQAPHGTAPNFPSHLSIQIQRLSINALPCDYASSQLSLISRSALPLSRSFFPFTHSWASALLKLPLSNLFSHLALNMHYFPCPWHFHPLFFLVRSASCNTQCKWWQQK